MADCTLRDGEQMAGLVIARERKVKIAKLLARLGVHEIEAGTPAVSEEDRRAVAEIAASMNGLGERAGNAATEQVVAALELLHGVSTGVELARLTEVARAVSGLTGGPRAGCWRR